jgi:hypothetical protein
MIPRRWHRAERPREKNIRIWFVKPLTPSPQTSMANHKRRVDGQRLRSRYWLMGLITCSLAGIACSSSSSGDGATGGGINLSFGGAANGASTGAGGTGSPGAGSGNTTAGTTSTTSTACENGKDDDGDGLVDGFDPECTGPLDNDEGSFATGIPGDNRDPKWQDCFFDGNSGAGDDSCRYATGCLTGDLPQTDPDCTVTASCIKFCAPLTQNGCDCFGCCTVTLPDGSKVDVTEVSTCSVANVGDEKACPRCTKSTQCGNTCGECELCAGKTAADLPAKCTPTGSGGAGGVGNTCDGGERACGPGLAPCAASEYCSFGCCIIAVR